MTSVVDETAWWHQPESSWLPPLGELEESFEEASAPPSPDLPALPSSDPATPPPYGYRYSEAYGYHPYVAAPAGAPIKVSRKAVVLAVTAIVVVTGVVIGALSATASPGGTVSSSTTSSSHRAATGSRHIAAGATTPPSTASSGGSSNQPTPAPTIPPILLAPGLFITPPLSSSVTTPPATAPAPAVTAPTPTTAPITVPTPTIAPTQSATSAAAQWSALYGSYIPQLESEASNLQGAVSSALSVGDLSGVAAGCQQFGNHASYALGLPDIPDGTANAAWKSGLSSYQSAAGECVSGVNNQDPTLLNQAATDLTNGTTDLQSAATALANA